MRSLLSRRIHLPLTHPQILRKSLISDFGHLYNHCPEPMGLVRVFHETGFGHLILAGTDEGNPGLVPGFSLHDELCASSGPA